MPCSRWNFLQLPSTLRLAAGLSSTFCTATGPFVSFPCGLKTHSLISSAPVNFPYGCGTFGLLTSSLRAAVGHFVKVPCGHVTFRQHFVWPWDLWYTPVIFMCGHGTFHQVSMWPCYLPLTFHAASGPSVNFQCPRGTFHQFSVQPWDFPLNSLVAPGLSVNFCPHSMWPRHLL